jgi:hypothetical protein
MVHEKSDLVTLPTAKHRGSRGAFPR